MAENINNETTVDMRDEYQALDALCKTLTPEQWRSRSAFYDWTPWDEVAHLCYFDETALQSVRDPEQFAIAARRLSERSARGEEISAIARDAYGHLDGPALLAHWRSRYESLADTLAPLDPKARLGWYGPPMSARSVATARLMETWAHGQDIWDVLRRRRPATARLKHIAHLGVTTFGWTFATANFSSRRYRPMFALRRQVATNGHGVTRHRNIASLVAPKTSAYSSRSDGT